MGGEWEKVLVEERLEISFRIGGSMLTMAYGLEEVLLQWLKDYRKCCSNDSRIGGSILNMSQVLEEVFLTQLKIGRKCTQHGLQVGGSVLYMA